MKTVNVGSLKNNPSEALQHAKNDMVLVINRNQPDTLMVGVNQIKTLDMPSVNAALASALFKDGGLSLSRAASLAGMTLSEFISHISFLDIPVISQTDNEVNEDMDRLDEWLKS